MKPLIPKTMPSTTAKVRTPIRASFPPYSEETLQYYLWGLRKGFLQPEFAVPDIKIPEEQQEYYYAGIREGENYGANGYPIDQVCYDLREGHHTPIGTVGHA